MIIIVLIIIAVVGYVLYSKNKSGKNNNSQTAKAQSNTEKKETFISFTDAEKQQLSKLGKLDPVMVAYKKSINGDAKAMMFLGLVYKQEFNNPKKSFYWVEKSARKGNSEAEYLLGTYYGRGYGVEQKKAMANMWIIMSAKKGNKDAIAFLSKTMTKQEMRDLEIPV